MKDAHLIAALERAVQRYGTSELPDDPATETGRPRRARTARRRQPGWVSVREIEASQSPNTYPRLNRREIKVRCHQLARAEGGPVLEVQMAGLRTWVRFAPAPVASATGQAVSADVPDQGRPVELAQADEPEREGQGRGAQQGGQAEGDPEPERRDEEPGADRREAGER